MGRSTNEMRTLQLYTQLSPEFICRARHLWAVSRKSWCERGFNPRPSVPQTDAHQRVRSPPLKYDQFSYIHSLV